MTHEDWIGTKEAALYASVSEKTIREWMDAGNLEYPQILHRCLLRPTNRNQRSIKRIKEPATKYAEIAISIMRTGPEP